MGTVCGGLVVIMGTFLLIIGRRSRVYADAEPLQDICVADLSSRLSLNGLPCTNSTKATDFFTNILASPNFTNSSSGSIITKADVRQIPGLNTLGVSLARIDFNLHGLNPPHTHPRATEIIFVLKGKLDVGFITTERVLISKTIQEGDVFVFPKGLVHYQYNNRTENASVISAFNSQLPGTVSVASTLFAAGPEVPDDILTKTFHVRKDEVKKIKKRFA